MEYLTYGLPDIRNRENMKFLIYQESEQQCFKVRFVEQHHVQNKQPILVEHTVPVGTACRG